MSRLTHGVIAVLLVLMVPDLAVAARTPCGSFGNFFSGHGRAESSHGVKASIERVKPAICGDKSGSTAWSMISGAWGGTNSDCSGPLDPDGLAQVGYGRFGSDSPGDDAGFHVFSQWFVYNPNSVSGVRVHTKGGTKPNETDVYKVLYNATAGRLEMLVGGNLRARTDFDPAVYWLNPSCGTTIWSPQFYGETHHKASDVPGTDSDRVAFAALRKRDREGNWEYFDSGAPSWSGEDSGTRYEFSWVTTNREFKIWTDPL